MLKYINILILFLQLLLRSDQLIYPKGLFYHHGKGVILLKTVNSFERRMTDGIDNNYDFDRN